MLHTYVLNVYKLLCLLTANKSLLVKNTLQGNKFNVIKFGYSIVILN